MVNRTSKRHCLVEELFELETDKEEDDNETDLLKEIDSNEQERLKPPFQRRPNKEQNHLLGHEKLLQDYFDED
jgi:transcription termination factor NusB